MLKGPEIEAKIFELNDRSDELINSQNYSQAIGVLKEAAAYDPSGYSAYVHKNLGDCYRSLKQTPQAIKEYESSLRYDQKFSSAYYGIALAYYDTEQYDAAAKYLRKLMQVTQDQSWINQSKQMLDQIATYGTYRAAVVQMEKRNYDAARKLFLQSAAHDPSSVSAAVHSSLAFVLRQSGNPEQAIVEGKKSLQFNADQKNVIYTIAICYQDIGQFGEAINWLQKYLKVETDPEPRRTAQELINDLTYDKSKQNEAANSLADYLDHMVGCEELLRWPTKKLPIKIYLGKGDGVRGFQPNYKSYVTRAMDTWCNASGNKLAYKIVSDVDAADIEIRWLSRQILIQEGGKKRIKQGLSHKDASEGEISHVRVDLDCMSAFEPEKPLQGSEVASICMHELGHALGLEHSTNFADIMYFGASAKQKGLPTSRDRNTIARLYVNYPVSGIAPIEKEPEPLEYLPPPAFVPPKPPSIDDLNPPVFLPPPIPEESEKLTPPFFKPAPIEDNDRTPPPPSFMPPELKQDKKNLSKGSTKPAARKNPQAKSPPQKNSAKKDDGGMPFFIPPAVK